MPSEYHPHSGRITGDLSLPLVMPPGMVLWPLKQSLRGCFFPRNSHFFGLPNWCPPAGFVSSWRVRPRPTPAPTTSPPRTGVLSRFKRWMTGEPEK